MLVCIIAFPVQFDCVYGKQKYMDGKQKHMDITFTGSSILLIPVMHASPANPAPSQARWQAKAKPLEPQE